jgi:hypothetical protein
LPITPRCCTIGNVPDDTIRLTLPDGIHVRGGKMTATLPAAKSLRGAISTQIRELIAGPRCDCGACETCLNRARVRRFRERQRAAKSP